MGLLRRLVKKVVNTWTIISEYFNESGLFRWMLTGVLSAILAWATPHLRPYLETLFQPAAEAAAQSLSGSYITHRGEHRCEKLPDSSMVCLNTNTEIHYNFNEITRYVELVNGEAYFVVLNNWRPFEVLSGGTLVHDVSTAFDVYRKRNSTLVTVLEGRVKVVGPVKIESRLKFDLGQPEDAWTSAPELRKFQQAEFDETTRTLQLRPALAEWRVAQLMAWKEGRIDLTGRPLSEALDEFARYQSISHFHYSTSLGTRRVGGDLEFKNLDEFLEGLDKDLHISHKKKGAGEDTQVFLWQQPNSVNHSKHK